MVAASKAVFRQDSASGLPSAVRCDVGVGVGSAARLA